MAATQNDTALRMTRRTWLPLCAAAVSGRGFESAQKTLTRVDTHLHCFAGRASSAFPYHRNAPYHPVEEASPEFLLRCMDAAGVDFAVVVHPEPYQDDHRYLEHCLNVGGGRFKGTCLFFADDSTAIRRMQQLTDRADIVAARVHAYAPDRLPPFGKASLSSYWQAAGELGLAVQLHFEPRYAPGFEPLIRDFPEIPVLIDHLGRPFQGTREEHETVVRWARFPNTILKLSSIPKTRNYPHRDPSHMIRQLCDGYGPDRMMYGGGFNATATGVSYRAAFEYCRSFLAHWSAEEQAMVLGERARQLFRFGGTVQN